MAIRSEVDARLKKLARTVKMDGFRPGKVPMSVVAQRYGYSVQYEVMNDKVGEAFQRRQRGRAARGRPAHHHREGAPEGRWRSTPCSRCFPKVKIGDLATAEVERASAEVTTPPIDKTGHPAQAAPHLRPARAGAPAEDGDRVTWTSKARSTASPSRAARPRTSSSWSAKARCCRVRDRRARHEGGREQDLPAGLSGRLPRQGRGRQDRRLPGHGQEDRGRTCPNDELAKSLGMGGTVEALRADIKKNLEREVKFRLLARNKQAVMDALLAKAELDVPKASVQAEVDRMVESAPAT
jgi:trigger factor